MADSILKLDPTTLRPIHGVRPEHHRASTLDLTMEELAAGTLALPLALEVWHESGTYEIVTLDRVRAAALRAGRSTVTVRMQPALGRDHLQAVTVHYQALLADAYTRPIERIRSAVDLLGYVLLWDSRVPEKMVVPDERARAAVEALTGHRTHARGRATPLTTELGIEPADLADLVDEVLRSTIRVAPRTFAAHWLPLLDAPDPVKCALTEGRITMAQAEKLTRRPDPATIQTLQAGGTAPSSRALAGLRTSAPPPRTEEHDANAGRTGELTANLVAATQFLQHPPDLTANERRKITRIVDEILELASRYAR